jgi:type 2 lantibiotic biosynthesis protein LanM
MEYIDAQPCENESQLADYFYRSGCLLSILYILEAEDIHFENLIAMKNNPVVIDLETLFHLRDDNILSASTNSLEHSVLKTHLIPQYDSAIPKNEPAALLSVSCKNLTLSRNSLPTLYGRSIPINDYNNKFINGFEIGYKALLSLKKQLPTHLNYFVGLSARYIARSTKIYSQLWKLSCQAYHQQSAVKLELFYDKLWLDVKKRPFLDKLIDAEKEALLQGDIPFFTHVIGSKAVQLDSNTERQHYFQQDAYSLVLAKVNKMSIQDCNAQIKIIQHSLNLATKEKPSLVKLQLSFSANTSANNWFECSRIIANKIVTQAIVGSEKIFWPTFITDNNGVSCLDSTNYRLYDGTLGIILSLAYIADNNPQAIDSALIKRSAEELLNSLTNEHFTEEGCGAFEGLGGVIYVISHLYHLWQEPWLLTSAKIYLNKLAEIVTMDRAFDIQKGSAGAILSLLSLHKVANNLQALQIAKAFGDHLVAFVKKQDEYYGWVNSKGTILSGFAHGSAGIAYALMKLYQMTSVDKYKAVAMQAITHEHACYCPKIGNWLDFRYDTLSEQKKAMSAWCNGAMGIGYSRMLMLGISNDSAFENMLLQDIDRAITNTLANPQLKEHGICHGHFGNQEFIYAWINSTQHSPDESQSDIAKRLPKAINEYLNDLNKNGLSPNSTYTESLGLMNGLAGISYQLLKFSLPNRLPSIMMLQPPVA